MSADVLAEVADLAQVDCTHVNDMNWENLYRAVVCHIANLPEDTTVIASRPKGDTMCIHLLHRWAGCPGWHAPDACNRLWRPESLQVLLRDEPTWIWVPRLVICRQHQRALGLHHRQGEGVLTCADPNCTRSHAPDWHRAELLAFHWLVKHHRLAGLGVGHALDGSLLHIGQRQARRILADMPYVDEGFYHSFRWHRPIPAPRPYGDMIVTATSRRANLNEQPRRRDATPRRATTPRRSPSRPRHGSPRPRPQQDNPSGMPPRKAPPVPPPVAEPCGVTRDPWATPTPRHTFGARTSQTQPTRAADCDHTVNHTETEQDHNSRPADSCPRGLEPLRAHDRGIRPTTSATASQADQRRHYTSCGTTRGSHDSVLAGCLRYPATPAPPRIPDALADLWLQRPPDNFAALLPPTHPAGQHGLLRSDSPFRIHRVGADLKTRPSPPPRSLGIHPPSTHAARPSHQCQLL